jgi:hypothetical protein
LAAAFIDLPCPQARPIASEILAAADDTDWQTRPGRRRGAGTMSAPARTPTTPAVPARAQAVAARLAALFTTDQEIVARLNAAHRSLAAANDQLWTDPVLDPLSIYEQIRRAFWAHQQASEQRRQLALDVGELSQQLTEALTTAGHPPEHARSANVHELATGTWQPPTAQENHR